MISKGNNDNNLMSDINVTPFVNVMLVLLIIFMVTAPMMVQGVNVSLPEAAAKASRRDPFVASSRIFSSRRSLSWAKKDASSVFPRALSILPSTISTLLVQLCAPDAGAPTQAHSLHTRR